MRGKYKFIILPVIFLAMVAFFVTISRGHDFRLFDSHGAIALAEGGLIRFGALLMLAIVLPTIFTIYFFAWRYREKDGEKGVPANDEPTVPRSLWRDLIWWVLPLTVVLILSTITWKSTHELDPYQPIAAGANTKPLIVRVVALNWKWLFIYPQQNIATVNFMQFPTDTPLDLQLTADNTPMNALWIPQLGGQMFAMAGMVTQLHLVANTPGEFPGSATEIDGRGFSGMKFMAKATSQADFDAWVASVKQGPSTLTQDAYDKLTEPSENNPVALYSSVQAGLYNNIVMKYMGPVSTSSMQAMPGMQMQ